MGDAPSAPSAQETSRAQTGTNIGTALANTFMGQVNQNTPYGSLNYEQSGEYSFTDPYTEMTYDIPTFTANTTLTPGGQRIQDNTMAAQEAYSGAAAAAAGNARDTYGTAFAPAANTPRLSTGPGGTNISGSAGLDTSAPTSRGAGAIANSYAGADDFSADRDKVTAALMGRMQPAMDQARTSADANMIARGAGVGSEAYGDVMGQVGQQENDARMAAILAGGEEQARMVGMARDAATFGNTAQGQRFGQQQQTWSGNNTARQQEYDNGANAQTTNFGTATQAAQTGNQARAQSLQEQYAQRNQGLNELGAILGQTSVQAPNFDIARPDQIAGTDVAGNIWNAYGAQSAAHQNKMAGIGSLLGSVTGLGMGFM